MVSYHSCFTCSLGILKCMLIICPNSPISGPRVKVEVELVRPSGLVFLFGVIVK